MHRTRIGDVEVLAVLDMVPPPYEPAEFFPGVPREAWAGAASRYLVNGKLQLYYGCFALRSPRGVVMVDTGKGPGPHPDRGNRSGDLLNQLLGQGITPEEVELVVHTHLHHDHVGWNVTWENGTPRPTFPRARYTVAREEWEHFSRPDILKSAPHLLRSVSVLHDMGLLDMIDGPESLTPEISMAPTPGHTPGHLNVVIESRGEKGAVVGDVLHSEVQIGEPGWCSRADADAGQAAASRLFMLERFERERFIVCAGHFRPDRQFGAVDKTEGRFAWRPIG